MSEPATAESNPSSKATVSMDSLRSGLQSDAGTSHVITISSQAPSAVADPGDFYGWPLLNGVLPEAFIQKVTDSRNAIPVLPKEKLRDYFKRDPKTGQDSKTGYTYGGKMQAPTVVVTPDEEKNPKLAAILRRVEQDMNQEGGISAVMTGDPASFTWGRGLTGGVLADAFTDFIEKTPAAKKAFLDCGITMVGKVWKIVDLESRTVKSGKDAVDMLNGHEPATVKMQLLSVFAKITEDHIVAAADAQWPAFKQAFYYAPGRRPPPEAEANWTPEAVAYVVHCSAWGSFKGWGEFAKTGGDLRKILRVETDSLPSSFFVDDGKHILVKKIAGGAAPATTMIFSMGIGIMWKNGIVVPCPEYPDVQPGDVVFEVHPAHKPKVGSDHVVLRGTARIYDPNEKYNAWVEQNQGLSMKQLLAALEKKGYAEVKKTRDWYASDKNPKKEKWGLRPMVAMDAVLHKGEKDNGAWILDQCERAGITPDHCSDQYDLIKAKIGIA